MVKVEDFFIPMHRENVLLTEDSSKVEMVIRCFEAISRLTYKSLYIIDYMKNAFLFMSNNMLYLSGHTPEEVREMGYMFYIKNVPECEQEMLREVNREGVKFIHSAPECERLKHTESFDFHIVNGKRKTLVNHKKTPILLNGAGEIWLAGCMLSLSSHQESGHVRMHKSGSRMYHEYSFVKQKWEERCEAITICDRENEILSLSAKGYTIEGIAERMCLSVDAVKFYRKRLFEKFGVKSITEALVFAENEELL